MITAGTSLSIHSTILIDGGIHFDMWKSSKKMGVMDVCAALYAAHEMHTDLRD